MTRDVRATGRKSLRAFGILFIGVVCLLLLLLLLLLLFLRRGGGCGACHQGPFE